jgi:hypothetical protein
LHLERTLDTGTGSVIIQTKMNVNLDHLGNCIKGPGASTAVRSILDDARTSDDPTPRRLPDQQHTISPAEFEATLWSVLGYEPEFSPEEEAHERT